MERKTTRAAEHSLPPLESYVPDSHPNTCRGGTLLPRVVRPAPSRFRVHV